MPYVVVSNLKKEKEKNKISYCLEINIHVIYSLLSLFALMEYLCWLECIY